MASLQDNGLPQECANNMSDGRAMDVGLTYVALPSRRPTSAILGHAHQLDSSIPTFPSTPSSAFSTFPNEIMIHILRYALHVHRVTPRLADVMGKNYTICNLSHVNRNLRNLAREIFYSENTITIQRTHLPSQLFSFSDSDCALSLIRIPSPTVRPLIKRLDLFITMNMFWSCHPDHYLEDHLSPERDLGVLLRPFDRRRSRTEWQKDMTALEDLRVVFKVECNDVTTMKLLFRVLPGRTAVDLRPRRLEVEVELVHVWWARECAHRTVGRCAESVREGLGRMVRLRRGPEDDGDD